MSDVYNSSYTGTQIDSAVGSVLNKESTWDGKQNKLTGQQGQVVGFDSTGNAVAQDNPGAGLPTGGTPGQMLYQGESGAEWGDKPIFRVAVTMVNSSGSVPSVTCDKTPFEIAEAYNKGFEIQPELRMGSAPIPFYSGQVFAMEFAESAGRVILTFPLEAGRRYMFFGEQTAGETPSWEVDLQSVSARGVQFSSTSGLTATNVRDAIEELAEKQPVMWVTFTLGEGNSVTADKTVAEVIQAYQDGYAVFGKVPGLNDGMDAILLLDSCEAGESQNIFFIWPYVGINLLIYGVNGSWGYNETAARILGLYVNFNPNHTDLTSTNVQDAIEEVNTKATRTAIPISIPTTGWADNKQTFTVTGIPSDPTTYEVHLSQVGATNVSAAIACGLYIADEAANSLTLAVSSVPEAAFQVYAVVQGVSV